MTAPPRQDYPRPQLRRNRWSSLNGTWAFAFDDEDLGGAQRWFSAEVLGDDLQGPFDRTITVPFSYQSQLSGIGVTERHDVVWYARHFDDTRNKESERLLLNFGAVDYRSSVWVNGVQVAEHEGGHTPFSVDVTDALVSHGSHPDRNLVVVRAEDVLDDLGIPRGKQYWRKESESIFYTPTTGIWQSVWLEPVPATYVKRIRVTPDLDAAAVGLEVSLDGVVAGATLRVRISKEEMVLIDDEIRVTQPLVDRRYSVVPPRGSVGSNVANWRGVEVWTPEHPALYDLHVEVQGVDGAVDAVNGYFGMRKIEARNGRVLLNGRPYYLRLVLDQGYFPGGLMTAPSDDDLRRDIELAKQLGFNGARKHQKVEEPRWLYWADTLGFLVWAEMPSAYQFSDEAVRRTTSEWQSVIARDYNHPCIIAWVPINESWGVPALDTDARQRALLLALYHLTHALDPTRLVVSNDGWEHAVTDLFTIHDYGHADSIRRRYADRRTIPQAIPSGPHETPTGRPLYTTGYRHRGEPILITEFGGVAVGDDDSTWGYHTVRDGEELLERYRELIAAVRFCDSVAGFCYTQLTDLEQEANGLLFFDRKPKADIAAFFEATVQ